ncbi:lipoprotein-releasing ABC transporter ATP-binding protein LolD [Ignatzschineria cameli]|uniref:Lipoprotein-releasing system ATP-binding protein LolD n=1 Tax=Ignatzschineria cameli TaxID=2182793 RepID=A0A2U2APV4_9GAMM|nr:lipoprotein-releasing ABC transporter ATP-binding protein LolD [Ignatzschineria cameli]PWD83421.1 lipoprotein-releasing ABC transporter ATP-binding protein LolD [Ignatzschineria cameli]PWD85540.1 lipoprotein-releasing ABC transporter ATP-binding protein LolD [Ignatzschineria cameli]PWD89147.1 lipoprotein-releasing ABC transporter ATP-binding protein LolD [Ignatzschineria cameli]PWD90680.1 lipoprotein-releasing ABC transporter ATP-binding protein LolD [Ignatzschineria cameli]PWD91383.1 lipop
MSKDGSIVLDVRDISKKFIDQKSEIVIFQNLTFQIHKGDRIAIVGASGAGKSTLMHIISGLDQPTSGDIYLNGEHFNRLSEAKRGYLRNRYLGFIYQFHHLLPEFTALDNVALPLVIGGESIAKSRHEAEQLLNRVGLAHRLTHHPGKLSGGERQRVAIARALVTQPSAVLADEPTGNLDEENAHAIFDLMCEINDEIGTALIVVTHDHSLARKMDQCWRLFEMQLHPVDRTAL